MPRLRSPLRWRPSRATLVAAALVILGLLLTEVSWWFVILVGLGALGPGVLREFGLLKDKDELQMRAAHRAGYHAFLVAGLLAFLLVGWIRSGERQLRNPEELSTLFLAVLWCTWLFSSLFAYWGVQRTAVRILLIFGTCWLLFILADEHGSLLGLLIHSLIAAPFFVLAWGARRWPRVTGILLLAAVAFFVRFFGWYRIGPMGLVNQSITMILFVGPLLCSGIALLGVQRAAVAEDEA
jgi:hypothetical protein